jgi:hypothetical protein
MLVTVRSLLALSCDACMRWRHVDPQAFAALHGLDMRTPLLTIARAQRCERCGARKGRAGPAPHDVYGEDRGR